MPDTCHLAPGAPLEREIYATHNYHSYILGLPTIGNDCGFGYPAIASRVSYYIDWIDSVIFPGKEKVVSEGCLLPKGGTSTCKRASECSHLVQDVKQGKSKLADYICQFNDARDPLVCCPKRNINSNQYDFESEFQQPLCVSINIQETF